MKLRLYPNKEQKEMLNKWAGCSRFTYNKVLETLNKPKNTLRNWMVLRNRYVTAKTRNATINTFFNDKQWLLDTPKTIRLEAVKECCKNRKSCFSNIMNGNVKSFFMEYKSKRKEQKKGWTLGVEKINVIRENDELLIFSSTFGAIRYASTKQLHKLINGKHPICDPKIQKDRYGDYYMLLPLKVKIDPVPVLKKEHSNVVSVDRGVKIFATLYDPKGDACFYGKNVDVQFMNMLEALDDKISERDRFNGAKQRKKKMNEAIKKLQKRIMNCKKELHHQFNNFITKKYTLIICPKLDTQKLSLKERRTLRTKTVRSMLNLGHCCQHDKLIHKCKERNIEMISPSEAYTSKTCPMCGQRKDCTSNRMKVCDCGYKAERDLNGALNILLRSIE
jgi:putative transposase